MEKNKRKALSLDEKMSIIQRLEFSQGRGQQQLANELCISRPTVCKLWKNRETLRKLAMSTNGKFKRVRKCEFPTVDSALLEWFNLQRSRHLPLNGPILKSKADEIAKAQNLHSFKSSNGWLDSWKTRHNIIFKCAPGESASVNLTGVETWLNTVWPNYLSKYDPKDIYNADETALFYRMLPQKTMEYRQNKCHGGKQNKERITLLLAANSDGSDKLKPLVIGKYAKPRCFHKCDMAKLPVTYTNNSKAWMTSDIWSTWLKSLNISMAQRNRKILLVVDNCSAHTATNVTLPNVEVVFLPPNATSILQPLDRGIINSFKCHFRHLTLKTIILKMDRNEKPQISILDAIIAVRSAWGNVTSSCISNCFYNTGLITIRSTSNNIESGDETVPDSLLEKLDMSSADFLNYVESDSHELICEDPTLMDIAAAHLVPETSADSTEENVSDDSPAEPVLPVNSRDALKMVEDLSYFLTLNGGTSQLLHGLDRIGEFVFDLSLPKLKQTTMKDFLNS